MTPVNMGNINENGDDYTAISKRGNKSRKRLLIVRYFTPGAFRGNSMSRTFAAVMRPRCKTRANSAIFFEDEINSDTRKSAGGHAVTALTWFQKP
jgi:hypothetical protein